MLQAQGEKDEQGFDKPTPIKISSQNNSPPKTIPHKPTHGSAAGLMSSGSGFPFTPM